MANGGDTAGVGGAGRGELRALTGARGVAAWLVVAYHLRAAPAGLPAAVERVLAHGYLAVDFFFLLSGFVIWMSWGERLRAGRLAAVPAFWRKRVARVWPLHLAMLAFALALAGVIVASGRPMPAIFPLADLPLHLLLVQDWGFADPLAWNDPAWSISAEMAAYLLFPLAAVAIDWSRARTPAVVAGIVALALLLHLVFTASGAGSLGADIARLGLARCLVEFTIGGGVFALWRRQASGWAAPLLVALALGAATLAGLLSETLGVPLAFAAGLLVLATAANRRGNPLTFAPLHWLGEVSYATYLSHYLLWFAFKLAFVRDPHAVPWPAIAAYALLVLVVPALLYHRLERPAQRAVERWRLPRYSWPRYFISR